MQKPIFIFSAGWRSGSTLLQRMITDSGEVLIWGEAGGALNHLSDAFECYKQMLGDGGTRFKYGYGGHGHKQYANFKEAGKRGVHKWIACMNPPLAEFIGSFRIMFESVYAKPAQDLGYKRWGVKEVQSGLEAVRFVQTIYPDSKIVFLVRNPIDCILSIKRRNWMDQTNNPKALEHYANHWTRLAQEYRMADIGCVIKYEDLIGKEETVTMLSGYLEIEKLSTAFTTDSHADWRPDNNEELSFLQRRRLLRIAGEEMEQYGYL